MTEGEGGESGFADNTELGGMADRSDSCAAIQRDHDRLEKLASRNCIKFDTGKCIIQSLGMKNLKHQYMLGTD